jgi:hypothetical protein
MIGSTLSCWDSSIRCLHWDLDIYEDVNGLTAVKYATPVVIQEVCDILSKRLINSRGEDGKRPYRQKAPFISFAPDMVKGRIAMEFSTPQTGRNVYYMITDLGIYDVVPFCWPVKENESYDTVILPGNKEHVKSSGSDKISKSVSPKVAIDVVDVVRKGALAIIEEYGFCVFHNIVPLELCCEVDAACREHSEFVLSVLDQPVHNPGADFTEFLSVPDAQWKCSPKNWLDAKWTVYDQGYKSTFGGGKAFRHIRITDHHALVRAQACAGNLVATLLGVSPLDVRRTPEGYSMKVGGSLKGPEHLDVHRAQQPGKEQRFQCLIPTGPTHAVLWPGSHKIIQFAGMEDLKPRSKYFPIDVDGVHKKALFDSGCVEAAIPIGAGSILVMVGGKVVHGLPMMPKGSPPRVNTYGLHSKCCTHRSHKT